MFTVARKTAYIQKQKPRDKRLLLSAALAATIGLVAFNLDIAGNWLAQVGRPDLAAPCYQVMTTFVRDLHIDDVRNGAALSHLADCYAVSGDLEQAMSVQQQAAIVYKVALGPESTEMFVSTARMAGYLSSKGNYVKAEMMLNDSVQELQRRPVPDTEATAYVYAALADTLMAQDKNEQALTVIEKLLPFDEHYMMTKQLSVNAYDKLGAVYAKLGRINLSKQTIEQGIALKERILGANNVQVARSYEKLSEMQSVLGEAADAHKSLERAQQIYRKSGSKVSS